MSEIWMMFCQICYIKLYLLVLPRPPPLELSSSTSTLRLDLSETEILDILLHVLKKVSSIGGLKNVLRFYYPFEL